MPEMSPYEARFGGLGRLYGRDALERIRCAHVCVVGLGGVGSWAVESLARSGIGALTLIDMDDICVSNVNRQLHALTGQFGKPKVEVLADRARAIHPDCQVNAIQEFFLRSNTLRLLATQYDFVIDAIDSPSRKALLIAECAARKIPVIVSGGSAGRSDPTAVEVVDLATASHDRLLREVRRQLRREHKFPRGHEPFGVPCILSREPQVYPRPDGGVCAARGDETDFRLDCNTGFGTASFVTGTFGLVAAARAISHIARNPGGKEKRPLM